jgi:hypothetical protein
MIQRMNESKEERKTSRTKEGKETEKKGNEMK